MIVYFNNDVYFLGVYLEKLSGNFLAFMFFILCWCKGLLLICDSLAFCQLKVEVKYPVFKLHFRSCKFSVTFFNLKLYCYMILMKFMSV